MTTRQRDCVYEGRRGLGIPGGGAGLGRPLFLQQVSRDGYPREQSQQNRRGTGYGAIGPLALSLYSQVSADFLEGDLQLPSQHEPFNDSGGLDVDIGA